jgi:hypothetical protein
MSESLELRVPAATAASAAAEPVAAEPTTQPPTGAVYPLRPDPLFHVVLMTMCAGVIFLSMILSVRQGTQVVLPFLGQPLPELCMMKRMGGAGCPGCGMTRSFISLGHGDLAAAWSYNPAGVWFFAIILFQLPYRGVQLWRIRRGLPELQTFRLAQVSLSILAAGMIGQWLLRMAGVEF